jgi:hypothetical protein
MAGKQPMTRRKLDVRTRAIREWQRLTIAERDDALLMIESERSMWNPHGNWDEHSVPIVNMRHRTLGIAIAMLRHNAAARKKTRKRRVRQ